jgi:hypothetical protein
MDGILGAIGGAMSGVEDLFGGGSGGGGGFLGELLSAIEGGGGSDGNSQGGGGMGEIGQIAGDVLPMLAMFL